MPDKRYRVRTGPWEPHFMTWSTAGRVPLLTSHDFPRVILDSLAFLRRADRIRLYAYVLLPDHLHLIAAAEDLTHEIQCFKSFTARTISDALRVAGETEKLEKLRAARMKKRLQQSVQVWEQSFHPKWVFSEEVWEQKAAYIHWNPVKHGLVTNPVDWLYSSIHSFYVSGPDIDPVDFRW